MKIESTTLITASAVLLTSAASCIPARFSKRGFEHTELPFSVRYTESENRVFVSDDWLVANYNFRNGSTPEPKEGDEYRREVMADIDNSGDKEFVAKWMRHDLELEHRKDNVSMSVRHEVLPRDLEQKNLAALVKNYVENLAGAEFGVIESRNVVAERRFATRIVTEEQAQVAGLDAYTATIELAQVDQIKFAGDAAVSQKRIVTIVRPPYQLRKLGTRNKPWMLPLAIIVEYVASPDDFDKHLDAYQTFLSLLELQHPGE